MSPRSRLAQARGIDPAQRLHFFFNGSPLPAVAGDSVASALLASGVHIAGRSFKLHRPRGLLYAGLEECNALLTVDDGSNVMPNRRATEVMVRPGLKVFTQNAWPSVRFDIKALLDGFSRFIPAGFYHKTFLWPHWHYYEWLVRRMAGLGPAPERVDKGANVSRYVHTEVLVVGAGAAGLAAARALAEHGVDTMVIEAFHSPGGALRWSEDACEGRSAREWVSETIDYLQRSASVQLLCDSQVLGLYDHGCAVAVQHAPPGERRWRHRRWQIRARQILIATGAQERPLVFPDNDRPGIRLLSAACEYLHYYGVVPASPVVALVNHDDAYPMLIAAVAAGAPLAAVVDTREQGCPAHSQTLEDAGVQLLLGYGVLSTAGRRALRRIAVAKLDDSGDGFIAGTERRLRAAELWMSGGWSPVVHLYCHAGGRLVFDDSLSAFVPADPVAGVSCVGAANGSFRTEDCIAEAREIAAALTAAPSDASTPPPHHSRRARSAAIRPLWRMPDAPGKDRRHRQWVDYQHDVTVADIDLALQEGFSSVELLKRYTATGMSVDQGKSSNINALCLAAERLKLAPGDVGTTRYRPPYHPVSLAAIAAGKRNGCADRYRELPVAWHREAGAPLEDHSGWLRPACYPQPGEKAQDAIAREALAARASVVLFDSSSLGKIDVQGADAGEFLDRLYINNIRSLAVGRIRYGMMLDDNGVIVDDGVCKRLGEQHYLVNTSSAGALDVAFAMERWLQTEWRDLDVTVTAQTSHWATIAVSGPNSRRLLERLALPCSLAANDFPHMHVLETTLQGQPLRVARVSFTGELCFELEIESGYADALWRQLLALGHDLGVQPLGMEALDILRVEKGFLEVGVDTDSTTTPLDVGWGPVVNRKDRDFVGRRSLGRPAQQAEDRAQLVGFRVSEGMPQPRAGAAVVDRQGQLLGYVSSSVMSPQLRRGVGLAMVSRGRSRLGETEMAVSGEQATPILLCDCAHFDPQGERLRD